MVDGRCSIVIRIFEEIGNRLQVFEIIKDTKLLGHVLDLLVPFSNPGLSTTSFISTFWNVWIDAASLSPTLFLLKGIFLYG